MKNYPKALADVNILRRTLESLYDYAESCSSGAETYRAKALENLTETGEPDPYYSGEAAENEANAAACIRLAERLSK